MCCVNRSVITGKLMPVTVESFEIIVLYSP